MLALARAIARAEIRRGTLAAGVCGYAVATVLIALASRPSDSYPVLREAVTNLVILGPALMAGGALLVARSTESGMGSELFLCGIGSQLRRRATAVAAIAVAMLVWLCGNLLAAGAVLLVVASEGDSLALVGHSAHGALWWAIAGLLALVLLALVGVACGCLCRSRVAALALVALLSGVPLMLATFGQFPPALWFRSLFPGGALDAVFDRREGVRGDAWLRWGVPATYLLAAFVIVAAGRRSSDPGVARAIKDAEPAPARGRAARLAGVAPIALLITAAAALGAVAPERMATAIPWWLQGPWIEDLALERASEPVARAYLSAVRSGDVRRERRLVLGRRALDPVQRALIGRARRVTDVTYVYAEDVPPGTVLAELGGDVTVTICNRRTRQGWRVVRVSTIGVCP